MDSYISETTQLVQVQASYFGFWEVIKGVPQGGPRVLWGLHGGHLDVNLQVQRVGYNKQKKYDFWTSWVSRRTNTEALKKFTT